MLNKGKKRSLEANPSPYVSGYPVRVDDESRARFKFQSLLQDYQELLQETEARKKKLQKDKRKKLRLLAEVKFLRAKQKSFFENPSAKKQHRFKKQKPDIQSKSFNIAQGSSSKALNKMSAKETNHSFAENSKPSTSAWLDLNQVSMPNPEDMEEFRSEWEQQKVEKSIRQPQNEASAIDLKLSICRNVGNNSNTMGKRKVTWEDQVALRV